MNVDLGQYAAPVLWAYAVAIGLLVFLVAVSLTKSAKVKRELDEIEKRRHDGA